ncbi:MAG: SDR family oxidoreductase [Paracoccaceae bacterium]|nr:SDR family oxidoreductase [Paracoccaceae bacterium]
MTDREGSRTAVITAAGSGIGRVIAESLAADGFRIWATDIDVKRLGTLPGSWQRSCVDAADPDGMTELFLKVASQWGRLDVLCANAGIAGPTAGIETIDPQDWRRCVAVNLEGSFLAARGAAPLMKRQRSGVMIFTASTAGLFGYPNRSPYAAAKWGVIGLMKTLAMELGPYGVRANAVCPGAVEGSRMERVLEREAQIKGATRDRIYQGYASGSSMGRWVTAQDVAEAVRFLASDAARFVSGVVLPVDGHTENPDPKV